MPKKRFANKREQEADWVRRHPGYAAKRAARWRTKYPSRSRASRRRWRRTYPDRRVASAKANYVQTRENCFSSYWRWDKKEIALVLRHEITDRALHALIGRSVQAIHVKRAKLKKQQVSRARRFI